MWDIANTISALVGLLLSGILVARFYHSYINRKYRAAIIGIMFFLVMTVLYLIPFIMTGITAYVIGGSAVFIASVIMERRNIPQKIFLSVTIYMLIWISDVIALLPWKVISKVTYLRDSEPGKQFALFIAALTVLVVMEKALLFLAIFITERIYSRKSEQMEWRELSILVIPYIAVIAGYWISSFMSDAYVNKSGEYIWNNYPVYELIRPVFGVIAFFVVISVIYSYQQIKRSQEEALSRASLYVTGALTTGMIPRLLCFAAASEMACQRVCLASPFFLSSFTTDLDISTGMTSEAPSSTAFWMISSILSALGSP